VCDRAVFRNRGVFYIQASTFYPLPQTVLCHHDHIHFLLDSGTFLDATESELNRRDVGLAMFTLMTHATFERPLCNPSTILAILRLSPRLTNITTTVESFDFTPEQIVQDLGRLRTVTFTAKTSAFDEERYDKTSQRVLRALQSLPPALTSLIIQREIYFDWTDAMRECLKLLQQLSHLRLGDDARRRSPDDKWLCHLAAPALCSIELDIADNHSEEQKNEEHIAIFTHTSETLEKMVLHLGHKRWANVSCFPTGDSQFLPPRRLASLTHLTVFQLSTQAQDKLAAVVEGLIQYSSSSELQLRTLELGQATSACTKHCAEPPVRSVVDFLQMTASLTLLRLCHWHLTVYQAVQIAQSSMHDVTRPHARPHPHAPRLCHVELKEYVAWNPGCKQAERREFVQAICGGNGGDNKCTLHQDEAYSHITFLGDDWIVTPFQQSPMSAFQEFHWTR